MPGVLIIEAMAQTAGIMMLHLASDPNKLPYFMSMDKVKFRKPVYPGEKLRLVAEVLRIRSSSCRVKAVAYVENEIVAEAELMCSLVDKQ